MSVLSVFLACRYLRRRKIVLLSIAAVALSCALLNTVAGLFTGFINAFEGSATRHMGDVLLSAPSDLKIPGFRGLIDELQSDSRIQAATAVLQSQGLLLMGQGKVRAVQVWGIELPQRAAVSPIQEFLLRQKSVPAEPSFAMDTVTADEGGFVGIGVAASPDEMTDEYDLNKIRSDIIGSRVLLTTGAARQAKPAESASDPQQDQTQYVRKAIRFTITDVVHTGMYELDQNFIYLPIETLSDKLNPDSPPLADRIQVRLKPNVAAEEGIAAVKEVWLRWADKQGLLWADYAKIDSSKTLQAQLIAEYHKQMQMLMMIFGLVSVGVILLVFCIFYLIVMTKQKDVAILKSCGLGSAAVGGLYVFFGLAIGAVGSGLGIALGYGITRNINAIEHWISVAFGLKLWKSSTYMFSRIPNQMDWESVVWITLAAILAAGIGSLIPAAAAARVRPVRLLRYE